MERSYVAKATQPRRRILQSRILFHTFCGYTDLQTYQDGLSFLLEAGGNQHVILQYLRIPIGYNGGAVSQDQYHQTTGGNRDIL